MNATNNNLTPSVPPTQKKNTTEQTNFSVAPFADFKQQIHIQSPLRAAITQAYRRSEPDIVADLIEPARLSAEESIATHQLAYRLTETLRNQKIALNRSGIVQSLLQEFSLSSTEGIALMCLAEALLRIPDLPTRDALIRDKISNGNWRSHLGHSPSFFVNAASWGLLITGKLVKPQQMESQLNRIIAKGGEPLIRKGVDMAMRIMGTQFVTGETIVQALKNVKDFEKKGFNYSYDMLGEAALTELDAQRYFESYEQAIHAIGKAAQGRGIFASSGISIKLSALHPRYSRAQYDRVMSELYPRLFSLALIASQYDISLNIDAEEADRLDISLDLLEKLCQEADLAQWNGIGFVIQAYQKRCPQVIDWLIDLATRTNHRLMIRLVKGAYWDSEIKHAQVDGLDGYPLYTRKVYTDISYLACARKLLSAPAAIYPQFATHNAHTLAAIYQLAGQNYQPHQYEFQCLHGMGESLYQQVVGSVTDGKLDRPCRIYAPVGTHETLLAYLVRRLLENGANTSFVNLIADQNIAIEALIEDPVTSAERWATAEGRLGLPHPKIPLPRALYGATRLNSSGIDLTNELVLKALATTLNEESKKDWQATSLIDGHSSPNTDLAVINPADINDRIGYIIEATDAEIETALTVANKAGQSWSLMSPQERAARLEQSAKLMEERMPSLIGLLIREAGKTFSNAIAEVREAIDFLRYYAEIIQHDFSNSDHLPLGPVVCISPWNFPLAIFSGQVAAALAAGNSVLAKPASQTPLIAAQAVKIMHEAGVPTDALQLLLGGGSSVGAKLVVDSRVRGVMFTGSTQVAGNLQRALAGRLDEYSHPLPLIAETGGLNAMIVDSSALTEQVVNDVVSSAFDSAGQRCSALRLLCLQEDIAEHTITMLKGAMQQCRMSNPAYLSTDIGPVIDSGAKTKIDHYIQGMKNSGHAVFQAVFNDAHYELEWQQGTFVKPTLIEIGAISELKEEIFGPVLHIVRFPRECLPQIVEQINSSGYGLTFGIHTRIDKTVALVTENAQVGNIYVNRNIVGAVVGVQPFGGEGLSGTGPKAGGSLYLYRLLSHRPADSLTNALHRADRSRQINNSKQIALLSPFEAFYSWLQAEKNSQLVEVCNSYRQYSQSGITRQLKGPTGETNSYSIVPRQAILCLADNDTDALVQLAAVLAVGSRVVWPENRANRLLFKHLPEQVQERISFITDWTTKKVRDQRRFDGVIYHGDRPRLIEVCEQIAQHNEPIISVQGFGQGETNLLLERLVLERSISVNTTAAGGNASLMTI